MELGLMGKAVLVLASSQGIGRGIATEFAREGARVMLFGRSEERLGEAQKAIFDATGLRPSLFAGDLSRPGDIEGAVERVVAEYGGLYALVNNCGGPAAGSFDRFDDAAWQHAFELTLLSYIRSIRAALPVMREQGEGRIVNIASSSVKRVIDNLILSNTFRMGVLGLTKSLARELGPHNILVNLVGAGKVATGRSAEVDGAKAARTGVTLEELQAAEQRTIPLGRYGDVAELARLAVFLCSGANTYITGQSILADGGQVQAY